MTFLIHIVFLLFAPETSWAKSKLDQAVLAEYLKIQKEFAESSCNLAAEQNYKNLDTKYRGDGNFIPTTLDQKVDQKTVSANLPLIKEKIAWIKSQSESLKKITSFEETLQILKRIENEVTVLQEAKKDYFFAKKADQKKDIEERATKQFAQLMREVENLKNSAPYLLSFKFPLDHLSLRAEYEKFKAMGTKEARAKANSIYLYRRVVQDGSYDENLTSNDSVIRAGFEDRKSVV